MSNVTRDDLPSLSIRRPVLVLVMNLLIVLAGLAALIDVVFATAIAYIVWRTQLAWRKWLDYAAMGAVAIPGVVIGIGYLRTFYDFNVPFIDKPLADQRPGQFRAALKQHFTVLPARQLSKQCIQINATITCREFEHLPTCQFPGSPFSADDDISFPL